MATEENTGESTDPTGAATAAEEASTKTVLGEAGESALAKERQAAREAAKQVKALTAKLKEFEDAKLSETERLSKQLEELKAERDKFAREARTGGLAASAAKHGASNGNAVAKLVAHDPDYADLDNEAAVAKARKEYPELFRPTGTADAGSGRGPGGLSEKDAFKAALRKGLLSS